MLEGFKVVLRWLPPRRRTQLVMLLLLSLVGAAAELASLGALLPFLAFLADPVEARQNPRIAAAVEWIGWTDLQGIVVAVSMVFAVVVVIAAVVRLLLAWGTLRFSQALGHELGARVYQRILHQPYAYHTSHNTSEVLAGIGKVDAVVSGIISPALDVVVAGIMVVAILTGLILIDWVVALGATGLFGFVYLSLSAYSKQGVIRNSRIVSRSASGRLKVIQEGLGGIRDILLDGSQSLHVSRFVAYDSEFRSASTRNGLWGQMPRYLVEALGIGVIAGIAALISNRSNGLTGALPVIGALALGAQKLLPLFQRVYGGWVQLVGNQGNLEDVAALAEAVMPMNSGQAGRPQHLPFEREIVLEGVGFRYRENVPWVFRGLQLTIPKGLRVGFAGQTGCGKSTLLDILMGLLTPSEGLMHIDGQKLSSQNIHHWQSRISHVPQNIFLADTTLAANIAFGELADRIDMERVKVAAKRARISDFIESLPEAYDTKVGERGVQLSGGQRQRVGIARALYRKADVLVLDEATSALDGGTESSVMDGLSELGAHMTVLIVAHRLSTLDGCDIVYRMGPSGLLQESGRASRGAGDPLTF